MSAVAQRPTGRRYDSAIIAEARRMAKEGGWTAYGIASVFNRRGIPVHEGTVRAWVDDRFAERRRLANQRRMRAGRVERRVAAGGPWFRLNASVEFRVARLIALVAAGLSDAEVGKVLGVDFGEPLTAEQVRRVREGGSPPRRWITTRRTA